MTFRKRALSEKSSQSHRALAWCKDISISSETGLTVSTANENGTRAKDQTNLRYGVLNLFL